MDRRRLAFEYPERETLDDRPGDAGRLGLAVAHQRRLEISLTLAVAEDEMHVRGLFGIARQLACGSIVLRDDPRIDRHRRRDDASSTRCHRRNSAFSSAVSPDACLMA